MRVSTSTLAKGPVPALWITHPSISSCQTRLTYPPHRRGDTDVIPITAGPARAWNAGVDGRLVLDPLCESAAGLLDAGGSMLLVQSALSGVEKSLNSLRSTGLEAEMSLPPSGFRSAGALGAGRLAELTGQIKRGCRTGGTRGDPGGQAVTERMRVQVIPNGPGVDIRAGAHRDTGRRRRRVRPIHGRRVHMSPQ